MAQVCIPYARKFRRGEVFFWQTVTDSYKANDVWQICWQVFSCFIVFIDDWLGELCTVRQMSHNFLTSIFPCMVIVVGWLCTVRTYLNETDSLLPLNDLVLFNHDNGVI